MTCGTSAARPLQSVRDPVCTFLVIVRAVSRKERVRTPRPAGSGKIKIEPSPNRSQDGVKGKLPPPRGSGCEATGNGS